MFEALSKLVLRDRRGAEDDECRSPRSRRDESARSSQRSRGASAAGASWLAGADGVVAVIAALASTTPAAAAITDSSVASSRGTRARVGPRGSPGCGRPAAAPPAAPRRSPARRRHRRRGSISRRCTSALVPTSIPRVGSSTMSRAGRRLSHLASTTFCWLPPDSVDAGSDESVVLDLQARGPVCGERPGERSSAISPCAPDASAATRSTMLRSIVSSITSPCWRRSSGTRADPGRHRRGRRALLQRRPDTVTDAGVVAIDAEDRLRRSRCAQPRRGREADDLAGAEPRS